MHKLAEVCIERPTFDALISTAVVVVDRLPKVDLPTVSVRTDMPGASTEEVETQVSQKIEEVVNTVEGITELRSISGAGKSIIIVTFALSRNIDVATQDVRDRVAN